MVFYVCKFTQHCFICRPSDFTVSEDAGIDPRTVATSVSAIRRSSHSATSHPQSAISHPLNSASSHPINSATSHPITRLHLIHTRLHLIHNKNIGEFCDHERTVFKSSGMVSLVTVNTKIMKQKICSCQEPCTAGWPSSNVEIFPN